MSALGQKQTFAPQQVMSALPPIATAKADMPQMVMSALPLKADIRPGKAQFLTPLTYLFIRQRSYK
jgi:hypothetical protein